MRLAHPQFEIAHTKGTLSIMSQRGEEDLETQLLLQTVYDNEKHYCMAKKKTQEDSLKGKLFRKIFLLYFNSLSCSVINLYVATLTNGQGERFST